MKRYSFSVTVLVFVLVAGCGQAVKKVEDNTSLKTYKNPIDLSIGDPHIMRAPDGRYYMYGSGSGSDSTAFPTFSSANLIEWKNEGDAYLRNPVTSWGKGDFWAPAVYNVKDKYYLFYSSQWNNNPTNEMENFRIGVAVSDKPTGPFRDIHNEPIFDPGYPVIDADVLFDNNGRVYLYYSRCCYKHPVESELAAWARATGMYNEIEESWVYGVELKPDLSGIIGEPVVILRPPISLDESNDSWENRSVINGEANRRWSEAPCSFRNGNTYYIMYSANSVAGNNYDLGYATSANPLGPFKKADNNPVTETKGDVINPAHNCVTFSPDGSEMYCIYGAISMRAAIKRGSSVLPGKSTSYGFMGQGAPQSMPSGLSRQRILFIDKMEIEKEGKVVVYCGNTFAQPFPSDKKN
ncbi:MAG: glycoside hydrolase family 43 protein [Bacteroidales bacterium]|nr:glycoside hydrolase family 43 protein [Bacteroidales bacterium]